MDLTFGPDVYLGLRTIVTAPFGTALFTMNGPLPTRSNGFVEPSTLSMLYAVDHIFPIFFKVAVLYVVKAFKKRSRAALLLATLCSVSSPSAINIRAWTGDGPGASNFQSGTWFEYSIVTVILLAESTG
ncbi:unannotated protein [freshwater metagenome]|uniref:Unannotated protein n=1 Tax=freshwater metagenome TaxID=449393 RepID=A0A6J6XCN9_9ZZZZ